MSEELKIFTKYSNNNEKASRYLWVFSNDDEGDLAFDHPDVLDWQSGLENLKQFHIEPVEKHEIKQETNKNECSCCCDEVSEEIENPIKTIKNTLEQLSINEIPELLNRFLSEKKPNYLIEAISKSESKDPVSSYKLRKIAQKLKII